MPVGEVLREHDDHQHLRELAHLELLPRDRDPALAAEDVVPDHEHEDEETQGQQIQERRERPEPGVVEVGDRHHRRDAEDREDGTAHDELHGVAGGHVLV